MTRAGLLKLLGLISIACVAAFIYDYSLRKDRDEDSPENHNSYKKVDEAQNSDKEEPKAVTVSQLINAYPNDRAKADATYNHHVWIIAGLVGEIESPLWSPIDVASVKLVSPESLRQWQLRKEDLPF